MKNKVAEAFFSLLALCLFSYAIAGAIIFAMLLIPVGFVTLLVLAIKEWVVKKLKIKDKQKPRAVIVKRKATAIIRRMPPFRRAA